MSLLPSKSRFLFVCLFFLNNLIEISILRYSRLTIEKPIHLAAKPIRCTEIELVKPLRGNFHDGERSPAVVVTY